MNNDNNSEKTVRRPFILDFSETKIKEVLVAYERMDEEIFKKHEKKKRKYFK